MADKTLDPTADLRYLGADSVRCPAGNLSGYRVCTGDAQSLGNLTGVLISPSERRLAYFVIETPGLFVHRRYLLPVGTGTVLQEEPRTIRISARKDELDLQTFAPRSVPEFSDEDLMRTMFPA
jgi:PRC-barrel domain